MKYSNEEKIEFTENAIKDLLYAIGELEGIQEYRDIQEDLKDIIEKLEQEKAVFEEAYMKECEQERSYENMEYERSVL